MWNSTIFNEIQVMLSVTLNNFLHSPSVREEKKKKKKKKKNSFYYIIESKNIKEWKEKQKYPLSLHIYFYLEHMEKNSQHRIHLKMIKYELIKTE